MEREYKITPYQLFSILFLIKVVTMLTYSNKFSHSKSIWDYTISSICLFFLTFVLVSPTYFMYKKFPNLNIFSGKLGFIYMIMYGLYFVFVACYFMGMFKIFITNVMTPYIPVSMLALFTFIFAIYSQNKGLHAIARTSIILLVVIIISLIFVYSSLVYKIGIEKFFPLFEYGPKDMIYGIGYLISRDFGLAIFPIIVPFLNGSLKKTIFSWNISTCFLTVLTITFAVGALGDYLETQDFPIYWSTKVSEIGVIKRLDAIYIGVFISGMFILISVFLYFFKFVCSNLEMKSTRKISSFLGLALVFVFGVLLSDAKNFNYFIYNNNVLMILNILMSFVLPLIYFFKELNSREKEAKK